MARSPRANLNLTVYLLLLVILAICVSGVSAFGAGNIPSFAYMEGRAFRHGDIEDALAECVKKAGGAAFGLGALVGKGSKFGGLDIKRVYFGNWLRDYSQAVDIAGLKKLQLQTIINLCMALGFLAHGYATHEFEVTIERLGVYLPTEHIDNPKGYGEGEDARKYDSRLRGPVDPRELEIDPQTGMKNYIANENGNWDTSKAVVRRTIERCVHHGRLHRSQGHKEDEYEAYRLLGQLLHTLEDFSAHSNFCELALVSMGHRDVFVQVGDGVRIRAPNGQMVAPLVTGTFGSSDFIHSLLGEATDHISEASVSDLNRSLDDARKKSASSGSRGIGSNNDLRNLIFQLPGMDSSGEISREMDSMERIRAGPTQPGGKRPEDMNPQELHAVLWRVLTFRDSVVKKIEKTIEKIPGLGPLIEKLMDSISVFVFTTLEPYLKPIMKTATTGLTAASGEVIDNHDQYEVFNDPQASDPTHSFLSKDHFNLILNEPAGNIAKIIVGHTVKLIVKAWDDTSVNVHHMSEEVLQCLFHPDFHNSNSLVQREMMQNIRNWVQSLGHNQHEILHRLSKEQVRKHENVRLGSEGGHTAAEGSAAYNAGTNVQHQLQGYVNNIPGVHQAQGVMNFFSNPNTGFAREGGGAPGSGFAPPAGSPPGYVEGAPVPLSGEAAGYYGRLGGVPAPSYQQQQHQQQGQGPPPVRNDTRPSFPSVPSFPGGPSSSFPSQDQDYHRHSQSGYAPSYSSPPPSGQGQMGFPNAPSSDYPSYSSPPPSFPGAPGPGGYGMPGGGPSFPSFLGGSSSYAPPPGPPPSFPAGGAPPGPPPPGGSYYNNPPPPPPGGW